MAIKYKLPIHTKLYELLSRQNSKNVSGVYVASLTIYQYSYNSGNTNKYLEIYSSIVDYLVNTNEYAPTLNDLETACKKGDEKLFDAIFTKINIFSQKCLVNACGSSHKNILKKLFDMKALPDRDCVGALLYDNREIFDLLLANGLLIDLGTIEVALSKNIAINNIDDMGLIMISNYIKYVTKQKSFR